MRYRKLRKALEELSQQYSDETDMEIHINKTMQLINEFGMRKTRKSKGFFKD